MAVYLCVDKSPVLPCACLVRPQLVTRVQGLCSTRAQFKTAGHVLMVVGIPNAGKSTLINAFREMALRPAPGQFGVPDGPAGMSKGT